MVVSKYNWNKIKQDYFNSAEIELIQFFATYDTQIPPDTYRRKTNNWRKEKEKLINNIVTITEVEQMNTLTNTLIETKKLILETMQRRITRKADDLPMIELKQAWDVFKVELGEPSTIAKSEIKSTVSFEDFIDQLPPPQ
jgi:hypothetical protein